MPIRVAPAASPSREGSARVPSRPRIFGRLHERSEHRAVPDHAPERRQQCGRIVGERNVGTRGAVLRNQSLENGSQRFALHAAQWRHRGASRARRLTGSHGARQAVIPSPAAERDERDPSGARPDCPHRRSRRAHDRDRARRFAAPIRWRLRAARSRGARTRNAARDAREMLAAIAEGRQRARCERDRAWWIRRSGFFAARAC